MNKIAIAFFALIAVSAAALLPGAPAPPSGDATAQTLRFDSAVNPNSYQYAYETSNGINAQEQGQLKQVGQESGIAAQGGYSYISPEGTQIQVTYVADENGFQPQGDIIPTPPPLPSHVEKLLKYLAEHAPVQQST
ncbi:cuticle protein CP14.6-like [Contarinia nasturtii]|uniref:cuticle protein CP14.6-like n=1 Tax=Contarinia nasturtii TaxID=265458 RepID=UPI0012D3E853|nr:cuticle protein CP14.6-like [Contarinia nasturtii]